jgi:hypothetical protein
MNRAKLAILSLTVIFVLMFTGTCFASEKVLFEAKKIDDIDQLIDRAKKGITDDANDRKNFKASLKNAPHDLELENYVTTQKLKEVQREDGTIVTSYVTTMISDIKKLPNLAFACSDWLFLLAWDTNDPSYSMRHVGNIHYIEYRDSYGLYYVKPQQSDYTWYRLDTQVNITSSQYGCEWYDASHHGNNYKSPLPITYGKTYYSPDPNVGYIQCTALGYHVAFKQDDYLRNAGGNQTWEFCSERLFADNM